MNPTSILGIIVTLFEETQRLANENAALREQIKVQNEPMEAPEPVDPFSID